MMIVTGTKRSGTSMWMQILIGAGYPIIGEAFPMRWEHTIKAANPEGFYESHLRRGIFYRTNPHPKTGAYLFPEQVAHHAVKVFIPGLVRSDRAFIGKVIATVREWREYESSIARLYAIEDESRRAEGKGALIPEERMPGALEHLGGERAEWQALPVDRGVAALVGQREPVERRAAGRHASVRHIEAGHEVIVEIHSGVGRDLVLRSRRSRHKRQGDQAEFRESARHFSSSRRWPRSSSN